MNRYRYEHIVFCSFNTNSNIILSIRSVLNIILSHSIFKLYIRTLFLLRTFHSQGSNTKNNINTKKNSDLITKSNRQDFPNFPTNPNPKKKTKQPNYLIGQIVTPHVSWRPLRPVNAVAQMRRQRVSGKQILDPVGAIPTPVVDPGDDLRSHKVELPVPHVVLQLVLLDVLRIAPLSGGRHLRRWFGESGRVTLSTGQRSEVD